MQNRNKGITLIALIITIIILLILVGVSINLAIKGDLFGSAEKAVSGTNDKTAQEQTRVDELMGELGRVEEQQRQDNLPGTRVTENTKYVSSGKTAWIPKGFTVSGIKSEQSIDNGLVIYDIPEGITPDWTNPDSVKTKYNQFVWIPVEVKSTDKENSIASFYRSAWTENTATGGERTTGLSTDYTEPYSYDTTNNYDQTNGIADQITELTKSIYKYGGFYIGRYEAGSKTPRTSSSGVTEIGIKQDMYPYIYVKWGDSMSSIGTTGAVYLSNSLYNTNEYGATSMLCTGACWDSMLDFIKDSKHSVTDSTKWGNYKNSETYKIYRGSLYNNSSWSLADTTNGTDVTKDTSILLTTGATERNCSKNIYDVAGNCFEWTTESSSSRYRVIRGRRLRRLWFSLSSKQS